jgi:hypothetical protein
MLISDSNGLDSSTGSDRQITPNKREEMALLSSHIFLVPFFCAFGVETAFYVASKLTGRRIVNTVRPGRDSQVISPFCLSTMTL